MESPEFEHTTLILIDMLSRTGITASSLASSASDAFTELEARRSVKIEEGDYKSAAVLQSKIERLKETENQRFRQELEIKRKEQLDGLTKRQTEEKEAFDQKWHSTFDSMKKEATEAEALLKKRHEDEHIKLTESSLGLNGQSPKWSPKLLDLRKSEESLLRMHDFIKAAKVKESADELEVKEMKAINEKSKSLGKGEAAQLAHRHKLEMDVLRQRQKTSRDEATITLKRELEILMKKFKVERQEMEKIQILDKADLEESIKGWYNLDRGLGLAPSLLVPTLSESLELMNPQSNILNRRGSGFVDEREKKSRPGSPKKIQEGGEKKVLSEKEAPVQDAKAPAVIEGEREENRTAAEPMEVSPAPPASVPSEPGPDPALAEEEAVKPTVTVPKALQPKNSGGAQSPYKIRKGGTRAG